jgi:hypothetical protein
MASNFKIALNRNNNSLYLDLTGDFDGSSAAELINTLKEQNDSRAKVYINTDGLASLYPFGMDVFQKKCNVNRLSRDLIFIGEHAAEIAPFGSRLS